MLLKHRDIEVVNILLPSGLHNIAAGIEIIEKCRKHLVIEKPMALRMDRADRLIAAASDNNVKLFVVKQNKDHRLPVKKIKGSGSFWQIRQNSSGDCKG